MADPFPEEPVEVVGRDWAVTPIGHPLTDRSGTDDDGDGWSMTESRAAVIGLTRARASFLAVLLRDRLRPVLVTDELSVLTPFFANVWQRAGGAWVVRQASGGLRNGFTGRLLDRVEDAWRLGPPTDVDEIAVGHLRPTRADTLQLTVIASLRHPARDSTLLGGPVEAFSQGLFGATPRLWGAHEPAGEQWDRAALTERLRAGMPAETSVGVVGDGLTGLVGAQRTRHGVEELIHLHLRLASGEQAEVARVRAAVEQILRHLALTSMPLLALCLLRPARSDLMVPPLLLAPPIPIAVLIGAPAVRSLGLDLPELQRRHRLQPVGRPRLPAALGDLGTLEPQAWERLEDLLLGLDPGFVDEAVGPAAAVIRSVRAAAATSDGPAGGEDA